MIRRPPRSTRVRSSAASDVYKRQALAGVEVAGSVVVRTQAAVQEGAAVLRYQETAHEARARLCALDGQRGAYVDAAHRVELSERAGAVSGFVAAVRSAD